MIYEGDPIKAMEDFKKLQEKKALRKANIVKKEDALKEESEFLYLKVSLNDFAELQKTNTPAVKPASDAQLVARLKFGMATQFLKQVRQFIVMAHRDPKKDPMAPMVSHLIKEGFSGKYPKIEIDYSKVKLGYRGAMDNAHCRFEILPNCSFYIHWNTQMSVFSLPDDKLYFIIYNINHKKFYWCDAILKEQGRVTVEFADQQPNERFALYVFIIDAKGKRSTNRFLGEGRFR